MPDSITESSPPSAGATPSQTNIGVAGSSETPVVASSHPFYLHPSDSPGMTLVSTIFDGKGYGGWRRGILIALSAKNKIGFIDGTILRPTISPESLNSWSRCNDMVISWLLNSLSKEIAESVLYSMTAREIWEELEERFGQSNGPQLYHLQKQISELGQGNLDIATYYTKLKRLWDELDSLDVSQTCTCHCTCEGKVKTLKSQQDARLIQFLMGLNESYAGPRSNLLMLVPLPSVNYAYSLLIRDEKQREVQISNHPGAGAFYVSKQGYEVNRPFPEKRGLPDGKKNTSSLICTYCKKQNHTIDNCYRLIGFPTDFKFTKSKKFTQGAKSNVACAEDSGLQARDRPMTQDQFHSLYQLLQNVKVGTEGEQTPMDTAAANCAGPFNEEATGSW